MTIVLRSIFIALVVTAFGLQAADNQPALLSPTWKPKRESAVTMVRKAKAELTKDTAQTTPLKSAQPAVQRPEKQTQLQFIAQMRAQVAQAEKEKEAQVQQQEEEKKRAAQAPDNAAPVVRIVSLMPRALQPVKPRGYNAIAPKRSQILKELQEKSGSTSAQLEAEADLRAVRGVNCKTCALEYLNCTLYTSAPAQAELDRMQKEAGEFEDITMENLKTLITQKAEYNQRGRQLSEFMQRAIGITRETLLFGQCSDHKKPSTQGA